MSFWRVVGVVSVVFLSGCGWLYGDSGIVRDTSKDYLDAKQSSQIQVPENYDSDRIRDAFPIPEVADNAESSETALELDRRPPLQILSVAQGLRANRSATHPSIYWVGEQSTLKQHFKDFLESKEIAGTDSERGVLTEWLITDNEAWWRTIFGSELPEKVRDRFLATFEPSKNTINETLMTLQHADQFIRVYGEDEWTNMAADNRVSTHFLNEFVGYLDYLDRLENARRLSKLNRGVDVKLGQNPQRHAALVAEAEWQTVWLKSPTVLKPLGFTLSDKDQSTGTYFFEFEPNDAGFFASLIGSDDSVELALEPGSYQAIISGKDGGVVTISFLNSAGEPLTDAKMAQVFPFLAEAYGRNTAKRRRR